LSFDNVHRTLPRSAGIGGTLVTRSATKHKVATENTWSKLLTTNGMAGASACRQVERILRTRANARDSESRSIPATCRFGRAASRRVNQPVPQSASSTSTVRARCQFIRHQTILGIANPVPSRAVMPSVEVGLSQSGATALVRVSE